MYKAALSNPQHAPQEYILVLLSKSRCHQMLVYIQFLLYKVILLNRVIISDIYCIL